jgi:hypothetical protein
VAEINLLKRSSSSANIVKSIPSLLVKFLLLIGLVVLGFYIWLNVQERALNTKATARSQETLQKKKDALVMDKRDELLTRQRQLKEYYSLLSNQTYFSQIFEHLAKQTYKNSKYLSLKASADGVVALTTIVPSLQDLDKIFQMFNSEKFMDTFSNAKVGGFYKNKTDAGTDEYKFEIKMDFKPEIIKASEK